MDEKQQVENHGGREPLYKEEYNDLAYNYCLLGARDKDLGEFFGVTERTINNWKKEYDAFFQSIKNGREIAWSKVALSLFKKTQGYEYKEKKRVIELNNSGVEVIKKVEVTTKHQPPDTGAIAFYLKNQARKFGWADRHDFDHSGSIHISFDPEDKELK